MLRKLANVIAAVGIALWFGGTVALLGMVQRLFAYDRESAVRVAPVLFIWFERYQLVLAGSVVIALAVASKRRRLLLTFVPAVVAAAIAIVSSTVITPRIDHLRQIGEASTPSFRTLHGVSMCLYLVQVVALLFLVIAHALGTQDQSRRGKPSTTGAQS